MIRRGTSLSKALALLVVASPLLAAGGLFSSWAVGRWIEGGAELAKQEQSRHDAAARTTQARLYAPLGEAWAEYAVTEMSGLAQDPSDAAAEAAVKARIETLFEESKAALRVVERLPDAPPPRPGLQQMRFELRGFTPETATAALLAALEAETPFLFVEFLDLQRAAGLRPGDLRIRLRFSVYRMTEAAS